jgi:hypothetical protein
MSEKFIPMGVEKTSENREEYVPVSFEIKLSQGTGVDGNGVPGRFLELRGGNVEKFNEALKLVGFEDYALFLNAETQEAVEAKAQDLKSKMENLSWQKEVLEASEKIKLLLTDINRIREGVSIDGSYKAVELDA